MHLRVSQLRSLFIRTILLVATVGVVSAQTYRTWDDGHSSDDWSRGANWSANNKPGSNGEIARFSNGNAGSTSIEINSNQRTGGMLFDANLTVDITFTNSGNELSIRNGSYGITNNSDQTITFENQIGIENDMTFSSTLANGGLVFETEIDTDSNDLTLEATDTDSFITVSGNIIDGGEIIKTGDGVLTLSGNNTYTGDTTISNGTLSAESNTALGNSGNDTTVSSGGTLALDGSVSITQSTIFLAGTGESGAGALQNTGGTNFLTANFNLTDDTTISSDDGTLNLGTDPGYNNYATQFVTNNGNDLTFTGAGDTNLYAGLTGSGDLIKAGNGTLTIEGTPNPGTATFSGQTFVNDGELVLATLYNDAPGVGPLDDFFVYNDITVGDGSAGSATLTIGNNEAGAGNNYANVFAAGVNLTVNADGEFNTQGHTQYVEDFAVNGGTVNAQTSGGAGNNLFIEGDISADNTSQTGTVNGFVDFSGDSSKSINVTTDSVLDINARIQNGGIDKSGDGTLILSGGNTFTDDVDVLDGIVRVDNDLGLGSVTGGTNVSSGAQLQLDGVTVGNEALSINGTGVSNDGALQTVTDSGANSWSGNVTVATNAEIQVNSGTTLGISGNITGSGKTLTIESIGDTTVSGTNTLNTLNKTGAGNLTVTTSPNTISTVNVNDGTFTVGTSNILNDSLDLNVGNDGTFAMGGGINETIDQFNSSGTLDIDGVFTMNGGIISGGTGVDSTGEMILTAGNTLEIASDFTYGTVGTMGGADQLGTLTLQDASRLVISGGSTVNIGSLNIDGDSIIDFTAAESNILNLGSLTFTAGSTLLIEGWNSFNDLWTTQNFPGANLDIRDDDTAKITFDGFNDTDTIWKTFDFGANEITVPEPSSYGAILMAFALATWTTRRPRRATI